LPRAESASRQRRMFGAASRLPSRPRFVLDLPFRFRTLAETSTSSGEGRVLTMSSGEVTVACNHQLRPGVTVELSIDWPAQGIDGTALRLVMTGSLVRCEIYGFAVASCWHRFESAAPISPSAAGIAGAAIAREDQALTYAA